MAREEPGDGLARAVQLEVVDTGVGMSPETLEHLFEPFYTTKELGRGTGLGLATVHGVVTQSGGTIRVRSAPGQGARFTVELPPHVSDEAPPADTPSGAPLLSGAGTVLLVEDEPAIRALAARVLRGQGYRVLETADAAEAFSLHASTPIDLLLSDRVLPGLSGEALADELRRRQPGLRVLLMSGYPDRAPSTAPEGDSTAPVLMKPLTPALLVRAVQQAMQAPAPDTAPPQSPDGA